MALRDIRLELQNPNSLTAQQIFAALFFISELEIIYKEEHAEFIREFIKAEEVERANDAEAKNYFAWKDQQHSIRDAITNLKQERKSPEMGRRFEGKPEKELQAYIADISAQIQTIEKEIEKCNEELKDYDSINQVWDTNITNVVKQLVGLDGEAVPGDVQNAVIAELRAAPPLAMVLATVGESYQAANLQPKNVDEVKPFNIFAESVLALKVVHALQKQLRKNSVENNNVSDFQNIIANNKFTAINLKDKDIDKDKILTVFTNGAKYKSVVLERDEKEKKLKELQATQKTGKQWLRAVELDAEEKPDKQSYSHYSLFGDKFDKSVNKQASDQDPLTLSDNHIKKQE